MLPKKLSREEPSSAGLSLSHPLSGLGARGGEDRAFEGRDRDWTEGPGAAAPRRSQFGNGSLAEPRSCTEWWQSPCQCSRHGPDCKLGEQDISQEEGTHS